MKELEQAIETSRKMGEKMVKASEREDELRAKLTRDAVDSFEYFAVGFKARRESSNES